jgi:hypothetical protein
MYIWTYYEKCIKTNSGKFKQKIVCISRHSMSTHKFSLEKTFYLTCVKIPMLQHNYLHDVFLFFYMRHKKVLFPQKLVWEHTMSGYFFYSFDIFKFIFNRIFVSINVLIMSYETCVARAYLLVQQVRSHFIPKFYTH